MPVSARDLVNLIKQLPRLQEYQYANPSNHGRILIHDIQSPEGPIKIKRYNPKKGGTLEKAKVENISTQMIWRIGNALNPGIPIQIDKIFTGSYNTRSVLEALLANCAPFYICKPGRIDPMNAYGPAKTGHKHLLYLPREPHVVGKIFEKDTNAQISVFVSDVVYSGIGFDNVDVSEGIDITHARRHAQIQIALVLIGRHFDFKSWVAANDRGIEYDGKRIEEMEVVIDDLSQIDLLRGFPRAAAAARLIDCVWFKDQRIMPAVMEIEHSTGINPGLSRMLEFHKIVPPLSDIRWTIVAPDEDRNLVIQRANMMQFQDLKTRFFPYSAVEELYSFCNRRRPENLPVNFIDHFMENCLVH